MPEPYHDIGATTSVTEINISIVSTLDPVPVAAGLIRRQLGR